MKDFKYKESVTAKNMINFYGPVRYMNGEDITYELIDEKICELADEYGIEMATDMGKVYYGMFHPDGEGLFLIHPKNQYEYYKFCILLTRTGKTCSVEVFSYGKSRQMSAEAFAQNTKVFDGSGVMGTAAGIMRGGALGAGFAIGSAATGIVKAGAKGIAKGLNALMRDSKALEEEKAWYDIVNEIIATVLS